MKSSETRSEEPEFCLYDEKEKIIRRVTLQRKGSYTLIEDPILHEENLFEIICSRRHWDAKIRPFLSPFFSHPFAATKRNQKT